MWSQILISLSAILSMVLVLYRVPGRFTDVKFLAFSAFLLVFSTEMLGFFSFQYDAVVREWSILIIFIFLLSVLLMTVRTVKPEIVRYPYFFVYIPFTLILAFPFVQGTDALINLILILLQGGAVVVLILLYAGHREELKREALYLSGVLCLLAAYVSFWFLESITGIYYDWIWQLLTSAGMICLVIEAPRLLNVTTSPASVQ